MRRRSSSSRIPSDDLLLDIPRSFSYGKGTNYKGVLDEYPGEKIGKGAILIEREGAKKVIDACKDIGVEYEERKVWL